LKLIESLRERGEGKPKTGAKGGISMTEKILVVEDEPHIQELLEYNLRQDGFSVVLCSRGDQAVEAVQKHKPDLMILDLMLPGIPGTDVCRSLKASPLTAELPIIMLTARGEESDKILGLELGADDYVTKPFSPRELVARVKAVLRRSPVSDVTHDEKLRSGPLVMDLKSHKVSLDKEPIQLTLTEFRILKALMSRGQEVLSRQKLVSEALGNDVNVTDRTVDVHLAALRKKIGPEADRIETVRGVGYRFRNT